MAYSDPYGTLLTAVKTRLVDATGPYKNADQVKLWADKALDELQPNEQLAAELSRELPIALVCAGSSEADERNSDGQDERQRVRVYIASIGPSMDAAIAGTTDPYVGIGALRHWVMKRLCYATWTITGWETMRFLSAEPLGVQGANRALFILTFESQRQQSNTET